MSMSNLDPSNYSKQWCNLIIGERDECNRGVDFATNALKNQKSPSDVMTQCTQFTGTEAYRYGCYLSTMFHGSSSNMCTANMKDANGNTVSFAIPCSNSCNDLFSDSGSVSTCATTAKSMFNQLVQNDGTCTQPSLSCVDGLYQSGKGYDCSTNKKDMNTVCLPSVVGCTVGGLQSQFLNQVQQYQQSQSQKPLSCNAFVYSDQPSGNGGGGGGGGGNNNNGGGGGGGNNSNGGGGGNNGGGNKNWNPFPEGNVYDGDSNK